MLPRLIVAWICCSALVPDAVAQATTERSTSVDPLPEEDILQPCRYSIVLPGTGETVRAAWVVFDRGRDFAAFYESRQVRAFASAERLALVRVFHCRSKQIEDMNVDPAKGSGRSLFTALDQFAAATGRPELRSIPVIALGWSGAGSHVGRLAGFRPERFLAGVLYAPGQYEPLGVDTIELGPDAIRRPQLILAGSADDHAGTERPYRYFKKYFDQGAPWTFVLQNGTPHCCLQNAQELILEWLGGVLHTDPVRMRTGRFGYLRVEATPVLDEWKLATFRASEARVGGAACRPRANERCAGWLPSAGFAESWRRFVQRQTPIAVWAP